jgi:hypothetical protein
LAGRQEPRDPQHDEDGKGRLEQVHHAKEHGALDIVDVGGEAHQQVAGAKAIQVAKGKGLNLAEGGDA